MMSENYIETRRLFYFFIYKFSSNQKLTTKEFPLQRWFQFSIKKVVNNKK